AGRIPDASASRRKPARKPLKSPPAAIALPPPSGMANSGAVASNARRLMRKGIIDMPPLLLFPHASISRRKLNFQYSDREYSERQRPRQPQRYGRDISDRHQHQKHDAVKRPDLAHDVLHAHAAHGASDKQRRADRRMAEADAEVHQHDHAEMDGVDAELHDHRQ